MDGESSGNLDSLLILHEITSIIRIKRINDFSRFRLIPTKTQRLRAGNHQGRYVSHPNKVIIPIAINMPFSLIPCSHMVCTSHPSVSNISLPQNPTRLLSRHPTSIEACLKNVIGRIEVR